MEYLSGLKGALFIKRPLELNASRYTIGEYSLQYSALGDTALLDAMKQNRYDFEVFRHCELGDKMYAVYSFDMTDFRGKSVGKAVFVNDITPIKNDFINNLIEMISFLVLLLILLVIGINWGFHKIISKLDESIRESTLAHKEMSSYVELIDQNVITSTTDLAGKIVSASSAFAAISGYSHEELIGQNHRMVRHPDISASLYEDMWRTLSNDGVWQGEIKNKKKDGSYYWVEITVHPIFDDEGIKIGYTAIRHDITDKKRLEEISITDSLTGIYNRRYFDQIFPKFVNTAKRNNDTVCFYMIDVDYFKPYNDHYGHQAGDTVLIKIAQAIQKTLKRSNDYCFRIGGEEFALLVRVTDSDGICDFGEQLRTRVEELKIPHDYNLTSRFVTISIGQYCDKGININSQNTLYKYADDLLYKAKESGRNQVKCNGEINN
jgi:diguanylate cyclase (GGDEF)-like protein/PAS domain S-box-containing protein